MKKVCPICRDAVKCRPIRLFLDQENVAVTATAENYINQRPAVANPKPVVREVIDLMSVDDDDDEDALSDDADNRMDDDDDFYSDIEPEIGQLVPPMHITTLNLSRQRWRTGWLRLRLP
jgi:hypothetical protein